MSWRYVIFGMSFLFTLQLILVSSVAVQPARAAQREHMPRAVSQLIDLIANSSAGLYQPLGGEVAEAPPEPAPVPAAVEVVELDKVIADAAGRYGVDPLLIEVVIWHESGFNPYALSKQGAMGLMQIMPDTAELLGLDDPWDPVQNVEGGTRYLADQIYRFGDLGLALAAYNAGPGAVLKYGGVPPYPETINYVDSILAEYQSIKAEQAQQAAVTEHAVTSALELVPEPSE